MFKNLRKNKILSTFCRASKEIGGIKMSEDEYENDNNESDEDDFEDDSDKDED